MKNNYRIEGNSVYIELNRRNGPNLEAIIDLSDFDLVNSVNGRWCASEDKRCNITYCVLKITNSNNKSSTLKIHRFITDAQKGMQVDHLNHNGLDNRRSNLRVVTDAENKQNWVKPKKNKQDKNLPVGVVYEKNKNSWIVRLHKDNDDIYLHSFATKDLAIKAHKYARAYYLPYSFEASEINRDEAYKILKQIEFESELVPNRSGNKSGVRNVSWHKRIKKWYAAITVNKKHIHLGYFDNIEDAAKAVEEARKQYGTSYWGKTVE